MKYLDEKVVFEFTTTIEEEGIYKYEVYKDGTIIFIGNTFLQPTTTVKLDITDIVKNYVSTLKPPFNTTTIEKSDIIDKFTVELYNKDNTDYEEITDYVFLTYRAPFYNSEVSTDLMDYTASTNKEQALLQGFNYASTSKYRTLLLPCYPAIGTTNLTFDYVGLFSDATYRQEFATVYRGFKFDINTVIRRKENTQEAGAYQFSIPLADFFMASSSLVTSSMNNLFNITGVPVYYSEDENIVNDGDNVSLSKEYINTRYEEGNTVLGLNLHYVTTYYTNGTTERTKYYNMVLGSGNNVSFVYKFKNILSISKIEVAFEWDDGGEEIVTVTPTKDWWEQLHDADNSVTGELTMELALKIGEADNGLDVLYGITFTSVVPIVYIDVCQAESIKVSTRSNGAQPTYQIAKFDNKSRYFLKWRDRYGMPQCQPFTGTEKYSEGIDRSEVIKYTNQRKIVGINVQPKWVLNTNWIEERYFPIYESIFVSPYLMLYDAKEDKIYDVILGTNEYEEKTARNQNKQLFNLQLEVELDTKQTMIY